MTDEKIKEILSNAKTIAMIGVSKDTSKTSTIVMKYMQEYGFKVIPVNPRSIGEKVLGEEFVGSLNEIEIPVDIVNVFRPSKEAEGFANETVQIKAKTLWLQLGIKCEKAKNITSKNNIEYIENRCTKMEYQKHFLKIRQAFPVLNN